jgi:hypothetical protein
MTPPNPPSSPSTASSSGVARCFAIFFPIFLRPTEQICPDSAGPFHSFDPVGFAIFAILDDTKIALLPRHGPIGAPMTKSKPQELYEKAAAERQRCRDWLLPFFRDNQPKFLTKAELRDAASLPG